MAGLQAEDLHNKQSQIVLRSRSADVDWAALRTVQVPNLVGLFTFYALPLDLGQIILLAPILQCFRCI